MPCAISAVAVRQVTMRDSRLKECGMEYIVWSTEAGLVCRPHVDAAVEVLFLVLVDVCMSMLVLCGGGLCGGVDRVGSST